MQPRPECKYGHIRLQMVLDGISSSQKVEPIPSEIVFGTVVTDARAAPLIQSENTGLERV